MADQLDFDADVPTALRRVIGAELAGASERLADDHGHDPVEAVHDARTHLKKARAALRLAEPDMPGAAFREANRALRDRGRALAGVRDADVLVEVVDALARRYAGRLPAAAFATARDALVAGAAERRGTGGIDVAREVSELRALTARAANWPLDACDVRTLARGLRLTYQRGAEGLARAERRPEPERLHEWRKRVKDLWYQQRLLAGAYPGMIKAQAKQARALSQLLGDDHDLALLAERLATDGALSAADDPELRALADARRAELTARALALGRLMYAEPSKAFGRRMRAYLAQAASGAGAPPAARDAVG